MLALAFLAAEVHRL